MEAAAIERDLPPRRGAAVGGLRSRNPWNINLIQTPSRIDKAFWDGDSDAGFEGESSRASDLRAAISRVLYRNGMKCCSVILCDQLDHFPSQCRAELEGSDLLSLLTQRRLLPETGALPHGQTCRGGFPR